MTHLLIFVLLPIISGLLLYLLPRHLPKFLAIALQAYIIILNFYYLFSLNGQSVSMQLTNAPLPFGMVLEMDYLSAFFMLLNNLLFFLLVIFSFHRSFMNRLFIFLFLSMQGMLNGLFLSTDFFNVYILIEVATITVSILIMYQKDKQAMYDGLIYLLVNMVAMAFFLFGVGYLYKLFGVLDFQHVQQGIEEIERRKDLIIPFAFLLTGVGLKAAIMPLFSWLPKAHGTASAPSIVSAILSGIFVKVGIYLLIRLLFVFQSAIDIQSLMLWLGFLTALSGFIFAMSQSDMKLILAYHTISQVGLILIGLSGIHAYNYYGGLYHVLAHGIFKSLLFIIAGILVHHYESREIGKVYNLWHANRLLSLALLTAVFSITGAPFFSGGFSKYFISYGYNGSLYLVLFWLINAGTMTSFIKFFRGIFKGLHTPVKPIVLKRNEKFTLISMSAICFTLGFAGTPIAHYLLDIQLDYRPLEQIQKLPSYVITYLICIGLFRFFLEESRALKWLRTFELTFNSISIAIVSFFFFTVSFLSIWL